MKPRKLRESVKKNIAYKQEYKCSICKTMLPPSFQVDHIIPHSITFDDTENNLQALCPNCHSLKTQKEAMRIIQFKKLQNECAHSLKVCWFCLQTYEHEHNDCSKILKDIDITLKYQQEVLQSFEEICEKYKYIKPSKKCFPKEKDDHVLKIMIDEKWIKVNDTICRYKEDITVETIADSVFISTRSKQESNRYSIVQLQFLYKFNYDDEDMDKCIEHISKELPKLLPERIFKKNINVEYEFF